MAGAGDRNERWTFERRDIDANGDARGPWTDGRTVWTGVTWLRGTEAVMQDRLTGVQPVVLNVRETSQTKTIKPGWRAIDSRHPSRVANITGISPGRERGTLDILATVGVAHG